MLRNDVPPPAPAVTPSMSRPASLNMPFSSATAHGSVATRRPYWLTVIFAAKAGHITHVMAQVMTQVMTMAANAVLDRMDLPPFFMCVDRTGRCLCKPCTLGFRRPARSHQESRGLKRAAAESEDGHENRAR